MHTNIPDCSVTRIFLVTSRSILPGDLQSEIMLKLAETVMGMERSQQKLDVWEI